MRKKPGKKQEQLNAGALTRLKPGLRMKGGVRYDPAINGFWAIVHSWDNVLCVGEPQEWRSPQIFPTEDAAMQHYKTTIRPDLERLTA
jgi:hypothetical protein